MKNYNEMAQRVLERRDEYELEKKVRNRCLTRTVASLACVAVVGFAAISLAGDPDIPHEITDPQISDFNDIKHNYTEEFKEKWNVEMQSAMLPCTTVTVNESDLMAVADMDVKFMEVKTYPTHLWIPEDWEFTGAYTLASRGITNGVLNEDYTPHDDILNFITESGNEVNIAMCDFEKPLRDCIIKVDDPKFSHIYGTETTILHINGLYNAQFSVNGLYFDIDLNCQASPESGQGELIHLLEQIVFYEVYYQNLPDSTDTPTKPVDPEDVPAVFNGVYYEAVNPSDLSFDLAKIFGGAYYNDVGDYVVILTEDTPENRAAVAAELNVNLREITFESGEYTLAYLTELQETISVAMQRREIPFVISSALYESKNRIGICVDVTNIDQSRLEEDYLSKVYDMDTLGGAIEVELVSGTPMKEMLESVE